MAERGGGGDAYVGVDFVLNEPWAEESHNVRLVGHSDLNGWGDAFQIQVGKGICYVAASGVNGHDGMTILDVSDPSKPKIINQLVDSPAARTHKVLRINDEVLLTNSELRPNLRKEYPDAIGGLRIVDVGNVLNDNGSTSGSAYVYRFDGTSWNEESKLTASDSAADKEAAQFVFDNHIIDNHWALKYKREAVRRVFHQPVKHERNPLIEGDGGYTTIVRDKACVRLADQRLVQHVALNQI